MDYGRRSSSARGTITWRYKALWVLGLFAGVAAASGGSGWRRRQQRLQLAGHAARVEAERVLASRTSAS